MKELELYRDQAAAAAEELVQAAGLRRGQILVVGCSTSAVTGNRIGQASAPEIGQVIFEGIHNVLYPMGIYLAAQCCEHLNRALIVEAKADAGLDIGGVLIGMHLKEVAVPVQLQNSAIGQAMVLAARTRPKFIGGDRAVYDAKLK